MGERADHGRFGPAANEKTISEWVKLGELRPVSDWVFQAAEGGSQEAIAHICGLGEDRLAPADLRDRGKAQCAELRGKSPAK